jgi:hypothetical protein
MLESPVLWAIISIAAPAILSFIGLWFSRSTKKVKIIKCYENILDTLFTLFVNEGKVPTREEIIKLGKLKCEDNNIKLSDLPDEGEFLDLIYAKVLESKIIGKRKRNNLLELFKKEAEKAPPIPFGQSIKKQLLRKKRSIFEERVQLRKITTLAAIFTIIVMSMGIITFEIIPSESPIEVSDFHTLFFASLLAILSVLSLQILYMFRQSIKRPGYISRIPIHHRRDVKSDLESILKDKSLKLESHYAYPNEENEELFFDYYIEGTDKTYLIEIHDIILLSGMGSFSISTDLDLLAKTVKDKTKYSLILVLTNANKDEANKIKTQLHKNWDYVLSDKGLKELKQIIQ